MLLKMFDLCNTQIEEDINISVDLLFYYLYNNNFPSKNV